MGAANVYDFSSDGYCTRLVREADPTKLCANSEDFWAFFTAIDTDYDDSQSKYGFDMYVTSSPSSSSSSPSRGVRSYLFYANVDGRVDYFRSALDCRLKNPDRKPDLWALSADSAVPR